MFLIVLPCSSICCVGILCQTMSYAIQMMFSVQVLIMFVIKCSPVGDGWGGYFRNSSKSRISCRTNITFNRLMMTSWDSWYAFIQSWTEDVRFCFNKFSFFSWKYYNNYSYSRHFRENLVVPTVFYSSGCNWSNPPPQKSQHLFSAFSTVANMAQFDISGHEIIAVFKEHQNVFLPPWIKITVNLRCNILFLSKIGLTKLGARCCYLKVIKSKNLIYVTRR